MKIKNSNKTLIAILCLVLTMPILSATILKTQIQKGIFHYGDSDPETASLFRQGSLDGIKTVRIIGPVPSFSEDLLSLSVHGGDKNEYAYRKVSSTDSIQVTKVADTLLIQYANLTDLEYIKKHGNNTFHAINIQLNINHPVDIHGDHVTISYVAQFPEAEGTTGTKITLDNSSRLAVGELLNVSRPDPSTTPKPPTSERLQLGSLNIVSNASQVLLASNIQLDTLRLASNNGGSLTLNSRIDASKISVKIDKLTTISGAYEAVKWLLEQ